MNIAIRIRAEKEAQIWFHKPYDECDAEEQQFCDEMAYEYCGG